MALFHLSVTQTKRSAGQSAIASAAYRAGERLYSEYYGEYSDYTRKGGVICSDILLPSHAPPEYADRQTLWNAVEKAERGKNAQLAYSFNIALQNEFSLEENIALARRFLLENFVSRGMVGVSNRHVTDGSLDFGQRKDVFHQLCHFGACEIFDLRGKALNRAAQIAKAVGALGAFAFLQILLSVLQTLQLVLFLCKLRLSSFLFGSELVEGFRFCHLD